MGTHVQLFDLQKITYQPTWLEHIPSTEQETASRVFTSLTPRALSEEMEKQAGRLRLREGFLGSETAEVGEEKQVPQQTTGAPSHLRIKGPVGAPEGTEGEQGGEGEALPFR